MKKFFLNNVTFKKLKNKFNLFLQKLPIYNLKPAISTIKSHFNIKNFFTKVFCYIYDSLKSFAEDPSEEFKEVIVVPPTVFSELNNKFNETSFTDEVIKSKDKTFNWKKLQIVKNILDQENPEKYRQNHFLLPLLVHLINHDNHIEDLLNDHCPKEYAALKEIFLEDNTTKLEFTRDDLDSDVDENIL